MDNYWLIQYQKLLDAKPKGAREAEERLEPELRSMLEEAGAEDYAPVLGLRGVLTVKQLSYMKDKELSEVALFVIWHIINIF